MEFVNAQLRLLKGLATIVKPPQRLGEQITGMIEPEGAQAPRTVRGVGVGKLRPPAIRAERVTQQRSRGGTAMAAFQVGVDRPAVIAAAGQRDLATGSLRVEAKRVAERIG